MIRPDLARFAKAFEDVARESTYIDHQPYSEEPPVLRMRGRVEWADARDPDWVLYREMDPSEIGERLIEALRREGFVVTKETL